MGLLASTHRWCAVIVGHFGLTVYYYCLKGALGCTCPWRVSNMLVHPHHFLILFWPIILFRKVFCRCYSKFLVVWVCIFFVLRFLEFCMIKYFVSCTMTDHLVSLGRIWYPLSSLDGSVFLCYGLSQGIEWCTDNVDIVWCVTVVIRYHLYFFDCSVCHFPSQYRVKMSCCWSHRSMLRGSYVL
jgi:hypothetical protein